MDRFVLGFAFNNTGTALLICEKQRPEWQKNHYNGIGGHIKGDEEPPAAMKRTCFEETGLELIWELNGKMFGINNDGNQFECYIFRSFNDAIFNFSNKKDEFLRIIHPEAIKDFPHISNLEYLIPYCLTSDHSKYFVIKY